MDLRPLLIAGGIFAVLVIIALTVALWPQSATNAVSNDATDSNVASAAPAYNAAPPAPPPPDNTAPPAAPPSGADPSQVTYYETVVVPDGPPATLTGASLVNTEQLADSLKQRTQGAQTFQLIDARGCTNESTIPGAICLNPNTIDQLVAQIPDRSTELVIFCHDGRCPLSYNLASAAVAAGYDNVFWYRGGINAWTAAGNPTANFSPSQQ
jgi:rhodanese-related sulfurtransferase